MKQNNLNSHSKDERQDLEQDLGGKQLENGVETDVDNNAEDFQIMDGPTRSHEHNRRRQLLLVLPLLVLPFVSLAFWALGGGQGSAGNIEGKGMPAIAGINTSVPRANISFRTEDKMALYAAADKEAKSSVGTEMETGMENGMAQVRNLNMDLAKDDQVVDLDGVSYTDIKRSEVGADGNRRSARASGVANVGELSFGLGKDNYKANTGNNNNEEDPYEDPNTRKVQRKLAALQGVLDGLSKESKTGAGVALGKSAVDPIDPSTYGRQPGEVVGNEEARHTSGNKGTKLQQLSHLKDLIAQTYGGGGADAVDAEDKVRGEQVDGGDPEMREINAMLDKVLAIQKGGLSNSMGQDEGVDRTDLDHRDDQSNVDGPAGFDRNSVVGQPSNGLNEAGRRTGKSDNTLHVVTIKEDVEVPLLQPTIDLAVLNNADLARLEGGGGKGSEMVAGEIGGGQEVQAHQEPEIDSTGGISEISSSSSNNSRSLAEVTGGTELDEVSAPSRNPNREDSTTWAQNADRIGKRGSKNVGERPEIEVAGAFYDLDTEKGAGIGAVADGIEGVDSVDGASVEFTTAAAFAETQTLVSGATVKMRLAADVSLNGIVIPKGTFVFGSCAVTGERLKVVINHIRLGKRLLPVSLKVFDLDGIEGVRIPGSINRDAAKQGVGRGLSGVQLMSMDATVAAQAASAGVEVAKGLLGKRVKLVRVTVKAGYPVLLVDSKGLK